MKVKPTADNKKGVSEKRANTLAASNRDPIDMTSVGGTKLKGKQDLAKADSSDFEEDFGKVFAVSGYINAQLKRHATVLNGSMLGVHVFKPF